MNDYSVVKISIIFIEDHCPFYKIGDSFIIKQQCFDPEFADPKQFCMHSFIDIYDTYVKVRNGTIGNKAYVKCIDKGKVTFEIERLEDEEGNGWN